VEEFKVWRNRSLAGLNILYLILDRIRIGVRAFGKGRGCIGCPCLLWDGRREVLNVALGNKET